jgi:hypothetical protein
MIYKNKNYGKVEDVTILEFGQGDILCVPGVGEKHTSVLFKTHEPHEIGKEHTVGPDSDQFKPDVVMTFNNPGSIDVVIEMLQKAKKDLLTKLDPYYGLLIKKIS